jgi:hypothetical protein
MDEREPAGATFELVVVEDRAQVPFRDVKLAVGATAMVVVVLVGKTQSASGSSRSTGCSSSSKA